MEEEKNPNADADTDPFRKQETASFPLQKGRPSAKIVASNTTPSGLAIEAARLEAAPGSRVEANSALLKIGETAANVSGFESAFNLDDNKSGITPSEDDDGGEAASARIAQEYRRQVRIKRLAEEIQQAEREKKKDEDQRRKTEMHQRKTNSFNTKKKDETAKLDMDAALPAPPESEGTQAKKRAAAMSAFKAAGGRKNGSSVLFGVFSLLLIGGLVWGAWWFLNNLAAQRDRANQEEMQSRALAFQNSEKRAAQDVKELQARQTELLRQKLAAEESAKTEAEQRRKLEEQLRQADIDKQKMLADEAIRRVKEEQRIKDDIAERAAQAEREKAELRKKIEDAQNLAREKLKHDQEEEAKKNAQPPEPVPAPAVADLKPNPTLPEPVKPVPPKPETPKPNVPITGEVKTIPSDPPVVTDKIELPSGGVRLFVKASDPYGGKLIFQWKQLKGTQVEIADPSAAKFHDGKWISQTYFIAREPGVYEFEVSVKNDEGVESKKKFPIEVLPPTTLK